MSTPTSSAFEKRKIIAHAIAGLAILLHAFEKWDHHSATWWVFAFFGILVLVLVANHKKLHHLYPPIDAIFFLIEATLMFVTAYYFFNVGKKYLPYCYLVVGVVYLVLTFTRHRKLSKKV